VADLIQQATDQSVRITPGGRGEFSVWVDGDRVAKKGFTGFPSDDKCVEAVRRALS